MKKICKVTFDVEFIGYYSNDVLLGLLVAAQKLQIQSLVKLICLKLSLDRVHGVNDDESMWSDDVQKIMSKFDLQSLVPSKTQEKKKKGDEDKVEVKRNALVTIATTNDSVVGNDDSSTTSQSTRKSSVTKKVEQIKLGQGLNDYIRLFVQLWIEGHDSKPSSK